MKVVNIGFASAGRRVELLRAFREAYSTLQVPGSIVAFDMDPLAPALQLADKMFIVPPIESPDYIPTLAGLCRDLAIDVIFPVLDPDIVVLAQNKKAFEEAGTRLAIVSFEVATMTADKWLTKQFFQGLGLRVPRSWLPGQLKSQDLPYPVFAKPRDGSAGKNCFQARDQRELEFLLGYVPNPMIEECLPGPEITTDVICDLNGTVLGIVSRKRIEVRSGEVAKGVTVFDQTVMDACTKIARALPAVGPLTVQCMMRDSTAYFTEINARFGGGLPLGIAAGVNAPLWLLAKIAGIAIEIPPLGSYKKNLYMTRYDDSFFLNDVES
jgi:carbamoyl-phosphate synthase large subunit